METDYEQICRRSGGYLQAVAAAGYLASSLDDKSGREWVFRMVTPAMLVRAALKVSHAT